MNDLLFLKNVSAGVGGSVSYTLYGLNDFPASFKKNRYWGFFCGFINDSDVAAECTPSFKVYFSDYHLNLDFVVFSPVPYAISINARSLTALRYANNFIPSITSTPTNAEKLMAMKGFLLEDLKFVISWVNDSDDLETFRIALYGLL